MCISIDLVGWNYNACSLVYLRLAIIYLLSVLPKTNLYDPFTKKYLKDFVLVKHHITIW